MEYSKEILKAYNNWMLKIGAEPYNEWDANYKNARRASKRAGDKFEAICKEAGLNYVKVAGDLCNTLIKL